MWESPLLSESETHTHTHTLANLVAYERWLDINYVNLKFFRAVRTKHYKLEAAILNKYFMLIIWKVLYNSLYKRCKEDWIPKANSLIKQN